MLPRSWPASHFSLPSLFITVTTVVIQLETYPIPDCSNIGSRSFLRLESSFFLPFLFIIIKCTLLLFSAGAKNTSECAARSQSGPLSPVLEEARTRLNQELDWPYSQSLPTSAAHWFHGRKAQFLIELPKWGSWLNGQIRIIGASCLHSFTANSSFSG